LNFKGTRGREERGRSKFGGGGGEPRVREGEVKVGWSDYEEEGQ